MYDNLLIEMLGFEPEKLDEEYWFVKDETSDLVTKATLSGLLAIPVIEVSEGVVKSDRPLIDIDGITYVTEGFVNQERVEYLKQFRDEIYGNVFFMGKLLNLHESVFGKPKNIVDMFLGQGGTILAGLECGIEKIVGFDNYHPHFLKSKSKLERYLSENNFGYSFEGNNKEAHYEITDGRQGSEVHVFFEDSLSCLGRRMDELGITDFDVITDIPWGYYDVLPLLPNMNLRTKEQMDSFLRKVQESIRESRAKKATVSHHKECELEFKPVKRILTPSVFMFSAYRF